MHVAIDGLAAKYGGAASVLTNLLKAALDDTRIDRVSVFTVPREFRSFEFSQSGKLVIVEIDNSKASRLNRFRWYMSTLGHETRRIGADALFCLGNAGTAPIPYVTYIQQSLPFSPEALSTISFRRRSEMQLIKWLMRESCKHANQVLVQTPIMLNYIRDVFDVSQARSSYILPDGGLYIDPHQEVDPRIVQLFDRGPTQQRLLYVGSDQPYKHVSIIAEAMKQVHARFSNASLILTLPPNHPYGEIPGVVCCGYLTGANLRYAYEHASAVVMPSLTETVGLPMLEAMSVGTPIIAADRPYAHFICENAALYFDPSNLDNFADTVLRFLNLPELHIQLAQNVRMLTSRRSTDRPYARMIDQLIQLVLNVPS